MIEQIITSTVLIIAVLLISVILEKRIGPCIKYALWLLVVVKLLVPLPTFESSFSVMNVVSRIVENNEVNWVHSTDWISASQIPLDKISEAVSAGTIENAIGIEDSTLDIVHNTALEISPITIGRIIWGCGVLLCAEVFVWGNVRFRIFLKRRRIFIDTYKNKLPIYEIRGIGSPCLFGLIRPAIYLDMDSILTESQKEYVLTHEYTHYKHGDHIWSMIRCICIILYWYNPFVWLAAQKSISDSELACDAGTLKGIGEGNRISYGKTLIAMAEKVSKNQNMHILVCSTSAARGMREMKKRMKLLVNKPKTMLATLVCLLVVCCGLVGCTFGGAVEELNEFAASVKNEAACQETTTEQDMSVTMAQESAMKEALEVKKQKVAEKLQKVQQEIETLKAQQEALLSGWIWPTENMTISANFGLQNNGAVSDHINIAGDEGDEIYAVVNGTIAETGFESIMGNYILLVDENNVSIKYGHLQEIFVEEGQVVEQGAVIATLGQTGTATGPNLSFAVYVDGEAVEPIGDIFMLSLISESDKVKK